MVSTWLIGTIYAMFVWLGAYIILRLTLGKVEEGFSKINERLDRMAKDNSGKAPLTGNNSQQKRDDKATVTGKPVDPNRPHTDKGK